MRRTIPKMLTIALTTLRTNPRFDLFADSLAPQLNDSTEVLVIDGQLWYMKDRVQQLAEAVRNRFSYRHLPPKPTLWQGPHRVTSMDYWDACSARNTAFAFASGTQIAFVDDCMVIGDGFVEWHQRAARDGVALAGRYQSVRSETLDHQGLDSDSRYLISGEPPSAVPCSGAWLFGMNMSVPLYYALKTNGYDEKFSGQGGSEDCDFGVRIERSGCKVLYSAGTVVYQVMSTHEAVCNYVGGDSIKTGRNPAARPKELRLNYDGKFHFANEKLIEVLNGQPERYWSVGNCFTLSALRSLARRGFPLPVPHEPKIDWRDGQLLTDM